MSTRAFFRVGTFSVCWIAAGLAAGAAAVTPNILVIVADDLGYADVGFNGGKEIPTPNLDRLATRGVRCTNGYVSHPFCSPTRAGLLTGRYQQRFGHENNPKWAPEDDQIGLPLSQTTLPQVLKTAGYVTGCIGKWHLGAHPVFHPNQRGFDHYFGLLGGGHIYFPGGKGGVEYNIPLDRNGRPEPLREYLTDVLGREAAAFVAQHRSAPWFLMLAFNAPHTPLQVTPQLAERVKHISDETRRAYAGLLVGLDDAVGVALNALRESGQEQNTLIFFFSDNGGPTGVTHADNAPLRGAKGSLFEGGVRVPFLVSWPAKLEKGRDYDQPVSSLDVFATAAELAGAKVPESHRLDGVNLIPFLTGEKKGAPRHKLFWRTGGGATWAVREDQWKLVGSGVDQATLFDLSADRSEANDVSTQNPEVTARLKSAYDAWNKENIAPLFESPRAGQPPRSQRGPAKVETK